MADNILEVEAAAIKHRDYDHVNAGILLLDQKAEFPSISIFFFLGGF